MVHGGVVHGYVVCDDAQSIQLHMQLLVHALQCQRADCPSQNCSKMKALLKHGASCKTRAARGCQICRRIWALLQIHARHCKTQSNCPVPRCRDLKDHLRRLRWVTRRVTRRVTRQVTRHGGYNHMCKAVGQVMVCSAIGSGTSTGASPYHCSSSYLRFIPFLALHPLGAWQRRTCPLSRRRDRAAGGGGWA